MAYPLIPRSRTALSLLNWLSQVILWAVPARYPASPSEVKFAELCWGPYVSGAKCAGRDRPTGRCRCEERRGRGPGGLPRRQLSDLSRIQAGGNHGQGCGDGRKIFMSVGRPFPDWHNTWVMRQRQFTRGQRGSSLLSLATALTLARVCGRCMGPSW
jgi:hypothetical protein